MPEILTVECPFCKSKVIKLLHTPAMYTVDRVMVGSNRKSVPRLSNEKDELLCDKCPNCGKPRKEIEKALKYGKEPSHEEVIRRLREAGLDPTKLK